MTLSASNMMNCESFNISSQNASDNDSGIIRDDPVIDDLSDSDDSNYRRECEILSNTEGMAIASSSTGETGTYVNKSVHFQDEDSDEERLREEEKILSREGLYVDNVDPEPADRLSTCSVLMAEGASSSTDNPAAKRPTDSAVDNRARKKRSTEYRNARLDHWKREPGCVIRIHMKPRRALFTPTGTKDGPVIAELLPTRVTQVETLGASNKKTYVINDTWTNRQDAHRILEIRWLGSTVFQYTTSLNREVSAPDSGANF